MQVNVGKTMGISLQRQSFLREIIISRTNNVVNIKRGEWGREGTVAQPSQQS